MDNRPYRRNKAVFLNFSGVLWTGLSYSIFHKLSPADK